MVDSTWVYAGPANPGAYAAAALEVGVSVAHWEQITAQHKEMQMVYIKYLSAQEVGKETSSVWVGNDALVLLKKQ